MERFGLSLGRGSPDDQKRIERPDRTSQPVPFAKGRHGLHIDVLRHEADGLLGVWDYKPKAAAERGAHIQVFLYALMLALRTGLPMSAFLCGYFDEQDAYVFRPSQVRLVYEL